MRCEHPECTGDHHSDRKAEACPAHYARRRASKRRAWARDHADPVRRQQHAEYQRQWKLDHPEQVQAYNARRREKWATDPEYREKYLRMAAEYQRSERGASIHYRASMKYALSKSRAYNEAQLSDVQDQITELERTIADGERTDTSAA